MMKIFKKILLLTLLVSAGSAFTTTIHARAFAKDMMKDIVVFSESDDCGETPDEPPHEE